MPKVASRQLPPEAAQNAINCDFETGSLKPFKGITLGSVFKNYQFKTYFPVATGYTFIATGYFDVVRSHAFNADDRFYFSDGTNKLRQSNKTLAATGGNTGGFPAISYYLGVPKPATALTVRTSTYYKGTTFLKSVSYIYTYIAEFGSTLREGPPSDPSNTIDVYENQYVIFSGMVASPPSGYNIVGYRLYRLEQGTTGADYELIDGLFSTGSEYMAYTATGYDRLADVGSSTLSGKVYSEGVKLFGITGTNFTSELAVGGYIFPHNWLSARKILSIQSKTELTIDESFSPNFNTATGEWAGQVVKYNTGGGWQLYDTSEVISAEDYDEAPAGLQGLIDLSNGCYAAFKNNRVYVSEPYLPDAWPYTIDVTDTIVAIGRYGTTLVVATNSTPYRVEVYDPAAMTKQVISQNQKCLFKRGMISGERFCIYPSPDGLFYIGEDGERIVTEGIFTKEQWYYLLTQGGLGGSTPYNKAITAFYYAEKYYAFFEGAGNGFIIDFAQGSLQNYTEFDLNVAGYQTSGNMLFWCGRIDGASDLRLALQSPTGGSMYLGTWNSASSMESKKLAFTWKSKPFVFASEISFERLAIRANYGPSPSPGFSIKVYCDGIALKFPMNTNNTQTTDTKLMWGDDPITLPYAVGREWEIEIVNCTFEVYEIVAATSMGDLYQLYSQG